MPDDDRPVDVLAAPSGGGDTPPRGRDAPAGAGEGRPRAARRGLRRVDHPDARQDHEGLLPLRGARHGPAARRGRRAHRVQPLRRADGDGRADHRRRVRRGVRARAAHLRAGPRHALHGTAGPFFRTLRLPARQPRERRRGARLRRGAPSSSPAATTTSRGPPARPTSSTSTAAPATCGRRCATACRSCRSSASAARRPSCTCRAASWLAKVTGLDKLLRFPYLPISLRLPVRADRGVPAQPAAADQDHHRRCSTRSTSRPSSGPTPTWPRSTRVVRGRMQDALDELAPQAPLPGAGLMATFLDRLRTQLWVLRTLVRSGMLTLMPPGQVRRHGRVVRSRARTRRRASRSPPSGVRTASALVDEIGTLTWRRAAAPHRRAGRRACRGRRADPSRRSRSSPATTAASSSRWAPPHGSAPRRCCSTPASPGPQLADVMVREGSRVIIYDEEFAGVVADARGPDPRPRRGARVDRLAPHRGRRPHRRGRSSGEHLGEKPALPAQPGRVILLTSGTTGTPKGARRGRRRPRRAGRDARPDPVAGRGDHRHRRADVPRLGLRPARRSAAP